MPAICLGFVTPFSLSARAWSGGADDDKTNRVSRVSGEYNLLMNWSQSMIQRWITASADYVSGTLNEGTTRHRSKFKQL